MKLVFKLIKEQKKIRTEQVQTEKELWEKYYQYKPHCVFIKAVDTDNKVIIHKDQLRSVPQYGQ